MTNTFMLNGERDPREILGSVKRGLYAVNFGGGSVDITSGKFVFSASEAYLIEDGKIGPAVKGATLIGNGPDAEDASYLSAASLADSLVFTPTTVLADDRIEIRADAILVALREGMAGLALLGRGRPFFDGGGLQELLDRLGRGGRCLLGAALCFLHGDLKTRFCRHLGRK